MALRYSSCVETKVPMDNPNDKIGQSTTQSVKKPICLVMPAQEHIDFKALVLKDIDVFPMKQAPYSSKTLTQKDFDEAQTILTLMPQKIFNEKLANNRAAKLSQEEQILKWKKQQEINQKRIAQLTSELKNTKQTKKKADPKIEKQLELLSLEISSFKIETQQQFNHMSNLLEESVRNSKRLEKKIFAISLGNLLQHFLEKNHLIEEYCKAFDVEESSVGDIFAKLHQERNNVHAKAQVAPFIVDWLEKHGRGLTLNDIVRLDKRFRPNRNTSAHDLQKEDVVSAIGNLDDQEKGIAEILFEAYYNESFETAWKKLLE